MGKIITEGASSPPAVLRSSRSQSAFAMVFCGLASIVAFSAFVRAAPVAPVQAPSNKVQAPAKGKSGANVVKAVEGPSITASRYVMEDDLPAYIASLTEAFAMRTRATDPFGQLQDPDAKRILKASVAKTSRRVAPVQATPFSDIIKLIKVSTIMPKEHRFLVGTRSIQQGDRIPLNYRGKTIRVEIVAVTSREIEFRNLEHSESASLKLNMLPAGMTLGSGRMSAPGMVPDRPDAAIDLDSGSLPNDKSPSR